MRERRTWTKDDVTNGLRKSQKSGQPMSDSAVRRESPALYGAAVRLFGSFTVARNAAGIVWKRARRKRSALIHFHFCGGDLVSRNAIKSQNSFFVIVDSNPSGIMLMFC